MPGVSHRIALVLWNGDVGGAEVFAATLARQLRAQGLDARIAFVGEPEPLAARLVSHGVPYVAACMGRGRDVLAHPRRYARLVAAAGADGAILVECGFMGAALRLGGYGAPVVGVEHGAALELAGYGWRRRLLTWMSRTAGAHADDAQVAVSRFVSRYLESQPHTREALVIHNGIDTAALACEPSRGRRPKAAVGFAARLIPGKGADHLIAALGRIPPEVRPRLAIAGDGPERASLQALACEHGVGADVEFLGLVHDIGSFWRRVDLAVVPSAEFVEACPMSPLEAMASARPVLATRNGGLPELIVDGVTGRLVAPGDVGELARALEDYARAPALITAHGAAAHRHVSRTFDISSCASRYLELLDELAVRRAGSTGR